MGKMENSAYIALSGQSALKRKMGVIADNLAVKVSYPTFLKFFKTILYMKIKKIQIKY